MQVGCGHTRNVLTRDEAILQTCLPTRNHQQVQYIGKNIPFLNRVAVLTHKVDSTLTIDVDSHGVIIVVDGVEPERHPVFVSGVECRVHPSRDIIGPCHPLEEQRRGCPQRAGLNGHLIGVLSLTNPTARTI